MNTTTPQMPAVLLDAPSVVHFRLDRLVDSLRSHLAYRAVYPAERARYEFDGSEREKLHSAIAGVREVLHLANPEQKRACLDYLRDCLQWERRRLHPIAA